MKLVDFSEKSRINPMISKVPMEEDASFLQRFASPIINDSRIFEIINMFRLQKSVAIPLSIR